MINGKPGASKPLVSLLCFDAGGSILGSGATGYLIPSNGGIYTTSGDQRFYLRQAGTLQKLYVWCKGNALVTAVTFTLMLGSGAGGSSPTSLVKVLNPDGGFVFDVDEINNVLSSANDWIELRITNTNEGYGISGIGATLEFLPRV